MRASPCRTAMPRPRMRVPGPDPRASARDGCPPLPGSAQPRRLRRQRCFEIRGEARSVVGLETRRGHPDAAWAGDPETVPCKHAPPAFLEGSDRGVLMGHRDPDVETRAAVRLEAPRAEGRPEAVAAAG